jgi:1-deoxy-D-xylulose-5-phosphate reductoisomerase
MPAVLNAANEVAVESFLKSRMPFTAIPEMIGDVMQRVGRKDIASLGDVLAADAIAREAAHEWLACFA